jgi:ribonuclease BN (tRNA processing enzyme)
MEIRILGNGGAICDGLPYNSFILDSEILVEAPPDIIQSLFRQNIAVSQISSIFISHFHGDHYFGIPFLALRQFFDGMDNSISVIGPQGVQDRILDLSISAFGSSHPVQNWIRNHYVFTEIEGGNPIQITKNIEIQPLKMFHLIETYGFQCPGEHSQFIYLADSSWHDELLDYISSDKCSILVDLNGEASDKVKIHISESDIQNHAIPFVNPITKFYGTHLKHEKMTKSDRIQYVKAGDEITV